MVGLTGVAALVVSLAFFWWPRLTAQNGVALQASDDALRTLAWSPDSTMLAVMGNHATTKPASVIFIWNVDTGRLKHDLKGHATPAHLLDFSADSLHLASYSDYDMCLWDTNSGEQEQDLPVVVSTAQWKKASTVLTLDGKYSSIVPTPTSAPTAIPIPGTPWLGIPPTPSSNRWNISTTTGKVREGYVPAPYQSVPDLPLKKEMSPDGHFFFIRTPPDPLPSIAFSGDMYGFTTPTSVPMVPLGGRLYPIVIDMPKSIEVWREQDDSLLKTLLQRNFKKLWWQDARHLRGIALVTSGTRFLEARMWDFDCQTQHESWQHLDALNFDDAHISPNKRWMSWDEIDKVRLFDLKTGKLVTKWDTDPDQRTKSAFSPNSRFLAWLDGSAVRVQRLDKFK